MNMTRRTDQTARQRSDLGRCVVREPELSAKRATLGPTGVAGVAHFSSAEKWVTFRPPLTVASSSCEGDRIQIA